MKDSLSYSRIDMIGHYSYFVVALLLIYPYSTYQTHVCTNEPKIMLELLREEVTSKFSSFDAVSIYWTAILEFPFKPTYLHFSNQRAMASHSKSHATN